MKPNAFIGIDPGVKGSIVVLYEEGPIRNRELRIEAKTLANATPLATWNFINSWSHLWDTRAVIEQQSPRPTRWFDKRQKKWLSSVLRSTVILYGSYMRLLGHLDASGISHECCPPQRWQKALHIPERQKGITDSEWKRQLKIKAQQLYPSFSQGITLHTADALLLAHYARENYLLRSSQHPSQEEE